jgi:hypothetical protein
MNLYINKLQSYEIELKEYCMGYAQHYVAKAWRKACFSLGLAMQQNSYID